MSEPASYYDDQTLLSKRVVRFGLIWGVWTIVTLFFSTQAYFTNWDPRRSMPYSQALISQASACYLWALATPLVLSLSQRYRIERRNWVRRLLLRLLLILAVCRVVLV